MRGGEEVLARSIFATLRTPSPAYELYISFQRTKWIFDRHQLRFLSPSFAKIRCDSRGRKGVEFEVR